MGYVEWVVVKKDRLLKRRRDDTNMSNMTPARINGHTQFYQRGIQVGPILALFLLLLLFTLHQLPIVDAAGTTIPVTTTADLVVNDGAACSLREAIREANDAGGLGLVGECPQGSATETDTIVLQNGMTYLLSIGGIENDAQAGDLDIRDNSADLDLIITTADPNGAPATIDAGGIPAGDRVFHLIQGVNAEFNNIIITGGSSSISGGGLRIEGGLASLRLINSQVTGNETTAAFGNGGGIAMIASGTVNLIKSDVTNNAITLDGNGAGIFLANGTMMLTDGSRVFGNATADGHGGGIYNGSNGTLIVENSQIGGLLLPLNTALQGNGGAIYNVENGTLTVRGTTIGGGRAEQGGGIWNAGIATIETNSQIGTADATNQATDDGGGVYNESTGKMTINNSVIQANVAGFANAAAAGGGGIYNNTGGELTLSETNIVGNRTGDGNQSRGGGIVNRGTLQMTGGEVAENLTGAGENADGAGIANIAGTVELTNVTVRDNVTGTGESSGGGGIWNDAEMRLNNTNVILNETGTAQFNQGGGILNGSNGVLEMTGGAISRNITGNGVSSSGGGIADFGSFTMTGGEVAENQTGTGDNSGGGGIVTSAGEMILSGVTVRDNGTGSGADSFGGAIAVAGAVTVLTIEDSTISGNRTGAGMDNGNDGGGIWNAGILNLRTTTLTGNQAGGENNDGGGLYNVAGGIVSMDSTVIDSNRTSETGNAADGGGIFNLGTVALRNSTVSGNKARTIGGGIYSVGTSSLTLLFSTVTNNTVEDGAAGGVRIDSLVNSAVFRGTIIADNGANFHPDCEDVVATITSEGYNLLGIGDGCPNLADGVNNDQVGTSAAPVNALLNELAANDGPTRTHALLAASPAIGAVPAAMCVALDNSPIDVDQRSELRPYGAACDIGAFEQQELRVFLPLVQR